MKTEAWALCPLRGGKTRLKIRDDTEMKNFPLFCPKCKRESLVDIKQLQIIIKKEQDA